MPADNQVLVASGVSTLLFSSGRMYASGYRICANFPYSDFWSDRTAIFRVVQDESSIKFYKTGPQITEFSGVMIIMEYTKTA